MGEVKRAELIPTAEEVRRGSRLASERIAALAETYHWKAANVVRFFENLDMTTKQKEEFLAKEFATIHWVVEK